MVTDYLLTIIWIILAVVFVVAVVLAGVAVCVPDKAVNVLAYILANNTDWDSEFEDLRKFRIHKQSKSQPPRERLY